MRNPATGKLRSGARRQVHFRTIPRKIIGRFARGIDLNLVTRSYTFSKDLQEKRLEWLVGVSLFRRGYLGSCFALTWLAGCRCVACA
jgi:hypothetical protein